MSFVLYFTFATLLHLTAQQIFHVFVVIYDCKSCTLQFSGWIIHVFVVNVFMPIITTWIHAIVPWNAVAIAIIFAMSVTSQKAHPRLMPTSEAPLSCNQFHVHSTFHSIPRSMFYMQHATSAHKYYNYVTTIISLNYKKYLLSNTLILQLCTYTTCSTFGLQSRM